MESNGHGAVPPTLEGGEQEPVKAGWTDRLNEKLELYITPQNIEMLRESCIFNIASHGVMGTDLPLIFA